MVITFEFSTLQMVTCRYMVFYGYSRARKVMTMIKHISFLSSSVEISKMMADLEKDICWTTSLDFANNGISSILAEKNHVH